ncbi:MAG TPA: polysaccharide deacetylase family protein [Gemmatimonadaceae bacterium]|jgi:peptidoglycan/xylan/chitin deacetylase (PgdA/CDA1 family)|nr:polysaccharide deacetylase family protein [Gemmatimonadaceae bacterium]
MTFPWFWLLVVGWMTLSPGVHARAVTPVHADSIRVPILVYHSIAKHRAGQDGEQRELDVDTTVFRTQMSYLANHGYQVISFPSLVDALQHGTAVPPRSVVITFDDGWETQYSIALPVLRQLHFTATFFIFSQPIGVDRGYMTWPQIMELQAAGMTIAAHSRTHPKLTLPTVSLASEVAGSRADIQREIGVAPDIFAYPYGIWDDRVAAAVRSAGFQAARALSGGEWNSSSSLFALHSVLATDNMQLFERALGP